jgi:hypothetical protein
VAAVALPCEVIVIPEEEGVAELWICSSLTEEETHQSE